MRVGKKPNVVEVKKTRSCVVRLEKVSKNSLNVSSSEEYLNTSGTIRLNTSDMGATAKGNRGISSQQDDKSISGTAKKKVVGGSTNIHSSFQTQKGGNSNMSNIRSNQKVKAIPRSNKTTPASTPSRDETPPPTIAAGRSRRAIKPNPKYASEDMVTPKVVRNVAMLASSGNRGGQGKSRKASTSSDDFYNRNSEDEYDNDIQNGESDDDENDDLHNDKAYQASEKDEQDSDFSVIEEPPVRIARPRGRPKRNPDPQAITQQITNKSPAQTTNVKRMPTIISASTLNPRSAPSQLQQIRRSLASSNAHRNLHLLADNSFRAHKRKLEEAQDSSDNESNYSIKHKQLLLSNSSGLKVKVPVRENRVNVTSALANKGRLTQTQAQKIQHQQTVNGSNKVHNTQTTSRRVIEIPSKSNSEQFVKTLKQSAGIANTNQNKIQSQNIIATQTKTHKFRSDSPKITIQKERQNNGATISISSSSSSASSLNTNSKTSDKIKPSSSQATVKSKPASSSHNTTAINSENEHNKKDDSPNSTIDDFETMPTFTIVNVNDIINKKGDVLITKSKLNANKSPTVIEFSESISLDGEEDENTDIKDDAKSAAVSPLTRPKQGFSKKLPKLNALNRKDQQNSKSPLVRLSESSRTLPTRPMISTSSSKQSPQILNHKLGLRNSRAAAISATTLTATLTSPDKPAPRILNSMVAKKTQPVKPMIANMEDSADESFPLSLDEDEDEDEETEDEIESRSTKMVHMIDKGRKSEYQNLVEVDTEDTESQNTEEDDAVLQTTNTAAKNVFASKVSAFTPKQSITPQRRRRTAGTSNTPIIVSSNKKRMIPAVAKENSLPASNQHVNDTMTASTKQSLDSTLTPRKSNTEKVVISKQGDKIIKKITCFETWYVINMPVEPKRPTVMKNQLEMPLIRLANLAKKICLPNDLWSSKVTLYELSPQSLLKGTYITYTGDLYEHNISEEDRGKYQPSCVMFRRSVEKSQISRMPYDRAVIFKNKTFYTNIEGKNVRLIGAPSIINSETEIEILLEVVDGLTLQSEFVEHISIVQ